MADWEAALKAIGGAAAIGGLIDLAMYKAEKKKLQDWLETWWLRFSDVKWSNFGRKEAELAVQILDRWAGPGLWSWKRWRFSLLVTVLALGIATLCAVLWAMVYDSSFDNVVLTMSVPALAETFALIALAFSLSLTRFIAVRTGRLCAGGFSNVLLFAILLIIHWWLLCYWSVVTSFLETLSIILAIFPFYATSVSLLDLGKQLLSDYHGSLPRLAGGWFPIPWPDLITTLTGPHESFYMVLISLFKILTDIIANGLRIFFALVFLSSFVFRPLIQEPISRLWYGAMNSGKPFFTMLFGAVATLVAVGQALAK